MTNNRKSIKAPLCCAERCHPKYFYSRERAPGVENRRKRFLTPLILKHFSIIILLSTMVVVGTPPVFHDAEQLLRKFSELRNKTNSFIIEGQVDTKFNYPDLNWSGENHVKFEDKYDGNRCKTQVSKWGNINLTAPDVKRNNANYYSKLWDGDSVYTYSRGNPSNTGMVIISRKNDPKGFKKKDTNAVRHSYSGQAMGYHRYDGERIDDLIKNHSEHLRLREKHENVGGVDCYIIDAVVEGKGKYTLWIDPVHAFHIAKIKVQRSENDHVFANRLKKGDYSNESFEVLRFKRVGSNWFPKECKWKSKKFTHKKLAIEEKNIKFTNVAFNPDHKALKSFLPTDIPDGTEVKLRALPPSIKFIWQDGEPVAVTSLAKTLNISFAGLEQSKDILAGKDQFINSMSPFDRSVRMRTRRDVSEKEFLRFVSQNVLVWKTEEKAKIEKSFTSIKNKISPYNLTFATTVPLVKTTGKEEMGGAYTRTNAIIIPERIINLPPGELENHILDEVFHIFLRYNPKARDALCGIIGFTRCNEIEIPSQLLAQKITDPDATQNNHYITVSRRKSAVNTGYLPFNISYSPLDVIPLILATPGNCSSGKCGPAFAYKLLVIEKDKEIWKPKLKDSQPVLLDISQVTGFYEKVGRNSKCIFHPEEVLVDNLKLLIHDKKDVIRPGIIQKIKELLMKDFGKTTANIE